MKRHLKRKISISIFIVMCIIVWWSITEDHNIDKQLSQSKKNRYVELFMNDFELTSMDENGKPSYLMTGSHLQRYNNSDVTEVDNPVIHLLQQPNQWLVSADTALFNSTNDTIQLNKNVVMQQQNVEQAMTMHTEKMLILTKTQIASTKVPVKISKGKSRLNAKGMIYNNLSSELKLLSDVNGYYTPDPKPGHQVTQ